MSQHVGLELLTAILCEPFSEAIGSQSSSCNESLLCQEAALAEDMKDIATTGGGGDVQAAAVSQVSHIADLAPPAP